MFQILIGPGGTDPTTIDAAGFTALAVKVVNVALALIGGVVLIYMLIAAIQYITAGGNESKVSEAKRALQAAIIGFIIVVAAYTLVHIVLAQLGFNSAIIKDVPAINPK